MEVGLNGGNMMKVELVTGKKNFYIFFFLINFLFSLMYSGQQNSLGI